MQSVTSAWVRECFPWKKSPTLTATCGSNRNLNQEEDNMNHGEWLKVSSLYKKCSSGSTPLKMFETGSNVQPLSIDEQLEQLQEFRLFSENL